MLQITKTRMATLLFLICLLCGILWGCGDGVHYTKLPPNYRMLCYDNYYLPTMPGGTRIYKDPLTYEGFDDYGEALEAAWRQYNYKPLPPDTIKWHECE